MKAYKLTNKNLQTHNGFQWELGKWKEATGGVAKLCSSGCLHYYKHPILAVLFNPIHADIKHPRLFEIECSEELDFDGLKGGCKRQRLVRELKLPELTTEQRIEFAIRVALCIYKNAEFKTWAEKWLSGEDRTEAAAVACAARAASACAAREAARAAREAAWAAACAARKAASEAREAAWAAREAALEAVCAARKAARKAASEAARAAAVEAHNLFMKVLQDMNVSLDQ